MIWDARRRVYVREDGSIVSPAELRELIEQYIESEKSEIGNESDSLIKAGASAALITAFFAFMREKLKEIHGAAGLTAYGGESEMNPERWARIGEKIVSETGYLKGFETAVKESRKATDEIIQAVSRTAPSIQPAVIERVILTNPPSQVVTAIEAIVEVPVIVPEPLFDQLLWGEVGSRSRLYADSVWGTHELSVKAREQDAGILSGRRVTEGDARVCAGCDEAATEEYLPLDELLDIGSAECLSACRCTIEYDYSGIGPLVIDRSVYV